MATLRLAGQRREPLVTTGKLIVHLTLREQLTERKLINLVQVLRQIDAAGPDELVWQFANTSTSELNGLLISLGLPESINFDSYVKAWRDAGSPSTVRRAHSSRYNPASIIRPATSPDRGSLSIASIAPATARAGIACGSGPCLVGGIEISVKYSSRSQPVDR